MLGTLEPIDSDDKRPEDAAREAADPNRLLEGEDPTTPHPEEARHWVDVYTELLNFKERTISTTQRNIADTPVPEAREEAEQTDMVVLEAERDRLRRRLHFWRERRRELAGK